MGKVQESDYQIQSVAYQISYKKSLEILMYSQPLNNTWVRDASLQNWKFVYNFLLSKNLM